MKVKLSFITVLSLLTFMAKADEEQCHKPTEANEICFFKPVGNDFVKTCVQTSYEAEIEKCDSFNGQDYADCLVHVDRLFNNKNICEGSGNDGEDEPGGVDKGDKE